MPASSETLQALVGDLPAEDMAAFRDGEALHRAGQFEQAAQTYQRFVHRVGDSGAGAIASLNLGHCHFSVKRFVDAIDCLDRALGSGTLTPSLAAEGALLKGNCLAGLGRFEDSLESYERAGDLQPDNAEVWFKRACCLQQMERHEDALFSLDRMLALKPGDISALRRKIRSLRFLRRREDVRTCENAIFAAQPATFDDWLEKARFLSGRGKWDEGLTCFERAHALDGENMLAWSGMSMCLLELDRPAEALRCCEEVLQRDPADASMWLEKAHCLWKMGDPQGSGESCDRALELQPDCFGAAYWKGMLLNAAGRAEEALPWLEQGVERDPSDALCWLTKGIAEVALSRPETARKSLSQVLELFPPDDAKDAAMRLLESLDAPSEAVAPRGPSPDAMRTGAPRHGPRP